MRQPLIIKQGLIKAAEEDQVQIIKLNLGPKNILPVTTQTITITATRHHLLNSGSSIVRTILGGEEGDILLLTGDRVRLRRGGNISILFSKRLQLDEVAFYLYTNGVWAPIG